jgi:RND superfamily putative drug exporter
MHKLAEFAVRRRWWVVGAWVAFIVVVQLLSAAAGGSNYKDVFRLPHTETETVSRLLTASGLEQQNGASGTVVLHAKNGTTLADHESTVMPALEAICGNGHGVASISSPYGQITCVNGQAEVATDARSQATSAALQSQDKTIGIVQINWSAAQPSLADIQDTAKSLLPLRSDSLQVEFTGPTFEGIPIDTSKKSVNPEAIGFLAALIILAFVFRTAGATALPLASAAAAIGSGMGLIGLLSHAMSVATFAPQLATLMILGVGIDYALFIVTRHRRNLLRGMPVEESISNAINTSGRAVLFAGTTVCIALMGLWALGVSFLYGVSLGTAIGVALTMVASLTLLPALLGFLGLKVLPRKQRRAVRAGEFEFQEHHGFWYSWARLIERFRIPMGVLSAGLLIVLALPFFSMQLGNSDQGADPTSSTTRRGYDLIAQGFGQGYNSSLQLVVHGPDADNPAYIAKVTGALKSTPDVAPDSVQVVPTRNNNITLVVFKTESSPQAAATTDVVKNLRSNVLPPLYEGTANHIYVYGVTAIFVDFTKVLSAKMPFFFIAVIGLSFLLLLVAFRSLVVPLTAAAMNLLAAGAAFGVVVAIFQWGWLAGPLGVGGGGPIQPFIPVMFFAILFGLSMDYQVFLVSRMHEEWLHTKDNHRAVTVGQGETGGIITAAAFIMIAVFAGFIIDPNRIVKLLGIGLASAVFLDAFVVRTFLVPSLMHIIGKSNWYFPKWLDRIVPQVSIEAADAEEEDQRPGGESDKSMVPV